MYPILSLSCSFYISLHQIAILLPLYPNVYSQCLYVQIWMNTIQPYHVSVYSHYHYYIASAHKMIGYRSYTLILLVSSPFWLTFPIFFLVKHLYVAYWNPNLGWLNLQIDTYSSWFPIFSLPKLMASHQCLPFFKGKQSHFCCYLTVV